MSLNFLFSMFLDFFFKCCELESSDDQCFPNMQSICVNACDGADRVKCSGVISYHVKCATPLLWSTVKQTHMFREMSKQPLWLHHG